MPALLDRLKKSIMEKQNITEDKAYAIATKVLQQYGYMKDGKLTAKGKIKQKLKEGVKGIPSKK